MSEPNEDAVTSAEQAEGIHPLEDALVGYPLRDASEDPGWAVKVVWTWIAVAVSLLVFFLVLLVLGLWYD